MSSYALFLEIRRRRAASGTVRRSCTVSGGGGLGSVVAGPNSLVEECIVRGSFGAAVVINEGVTIRDCVISGYAQAGIGTLGGDTVVARNTIDGDGGGACGLNISGANNRIEANHFSEIAAFGICLTSASMGTSVFLNSFTTVAAPLSDSGTANDIGPFQTAATGTSPFANIIVLNLPSPTPPPPTPTATRTSTSTPTTAPPTATPPPAGTPTPSES